MNNISISDNIKRIRENIEAAAAGTGRSGSGITLVAASKTKPAALIQQAITAGVDAVGENRVQELLEKHQQGAYAGAPLHFIGHLQTNKINKLVGVCKLIETVSSARHLELIDKRALSLNITQEILIEVNIGREAQKSGVIPEHLDDLLSAASQKQNVKVLGLMSIPPFCDDFMKNYYYFDIMYKLFVDISTKKYDNVSIRLLSMGMSDTYTDAIRAGANMVRIGSAIFGER